MSPTNEKHSTAHRRRSYGPPWTCRCGAILLALMSTAIAFGQDPEPPKPKDEKDRQLAESLMRKASTGAAEDLMDSIIRLMRESARRIEYDFDAGDETQAVQRQIVGRLDEAIKIAASQRRPKRSRQRSGDKRRMAEPGDGSKDESASSRGQAGQTTDVTEPSAGGVVTDSKLKSGTLEETRRTWGHLPLRDRDALIQGSGEAYLERYREWIERYYRALQESDE